MVLILAAASGLVYWSLATEAGTRWTLQTAARQLDAEVGGVRGTIWDGVRIEHVAIQTPDFVLALQNFHLEVSWNELIDHRLHARNLSADSVLLDLLTGPQNEEPPQPFQMPVLPVKVSIDRFAVGELSVRRDGEALPVTVRALTSSLAMSEQTAQVVITRLDVANDTIRADIQGEVNLLKLADPWPLRARLVTRARGLSSDSPLCVRHFMPTLPNASKESTPDEPPCELEIQTDLDGSLDELKLVLSGHGQGMQLQAQAELVPGDLFPVKTAVVDLALADGSSLYGKVDWASTRVDQAVHDHLAGTIRSRNLDLGQLLGSVIPPAVLTSTIDFDARLINQQTLVSADLAIAFGSGSRWNSQPLSGSLKTRIDSAAMPAAAASAVSSSAPDSTHPGGALLWQALQLSNLSMDLTLGKNRLRGDGSLGAAASNVTLDLSLPQLAAFWPGMAGGARLEGRIAGTMAAHQADLKVMYAPDHSKPDRVGEAPVNAALHIAGGWGVGSSPQDTLPGWRGKISGLSIGHAGITVGVKEPVALSFVPLAQAPAWQWQIGAGAIQIGLPSRHSVLIAHGGSRGGSGRWETKGAIDKLVISRRLIQDVQKLFDVEKKETIDRGGVNVKAERGNDLKEIVFGLDWDLKFAGVLEGQARIKRLSGDLMVPAQPDFPLGLETFNLTLNAKKQGPSASQLTADLSVTTAKMGRASARASMLLRMSPDGQFLFNAKEPKTVSIDADINDLGWVSLFVGDAMEFGGALTANIQAKSGADGKWETAGTVNGKGLRFIRIDDGVRLLDGTLAAHLSNDRFILDSLSFPARLRVTPKEWRTNEWITTNADAKGGHLTLSGDWDLFKSAGQVNIDLYRYPIMQRSDRYAMVTGKLTVVADIPKIAVSGKITADAGWFDLDVLSSIPSVDSDVVVIRPGEAKSVSVPAEISLDLNVDLGPRFYITGFGLDSGLVGSIHLMMIKNKLTAVGAFRTRGGAIEAYGQRLQVRRGTITFQGDIASPVLNIEAVRTDAAVQAGVRVAGTAKRPRIDLVSYPDVSDVEKLSWLLLGRGPDQSGGDAAMLISVGTSLLGGGAPFYRRFGLDDVSVRSGTLGSTGSILPVESVVSGLSSDTSELERQFITVSKKLSNGITLSVQQALATTGTVGRVSYRLAKGLTAELSAGTVNGIALVYRTFFMD